MIEAFDEPSVSVPSTYTELHDVDTYAGIDESKLSTFRERRTRKASKNSL